MYPVGCTANTVYGSGAYCLRSRCTPRLPRSAFSRAAHPLGTGRRTVKITGDDHDGQGRPGRELPNAHWSTYLCPLVRFWVRRSGQNPPDCVSLPS